MEIDDRMVHLARNAMLVAGMEMGKDGDHWPVIKANIHALMRDYEQLKIERAVQEQLREHVGKIIGEYEQAMTTCSEALRIKAEPHVRQLREIYDAMFSPMSDEARRQSYEKMLEEDESGFYATSKSSAAIIRSLTEEADQ